MNSSDPTYKVGYDQTTKPLKLDCQLQQYNTGTTLSLVKLNLLVQLSNTKLLSAWPRWMKPKHQHINPQKGFIYMTMFESSYVITPHGGSQMIITKQKREHSIKA